MSCNHNVDIEAMKDCPGCLRERVEDAEPKAIAFKSLLAELWDGVRIHKLKAPTKGREGERLIHAYCGGIAELRNRLEDVEQVEITTRETGLMLKRQLAEAEVREQKIKDGVTAAWNDGAKWEKKFHGVEKDRDALAHALEWLWANVKNSRMTQELRTAVEDALAVPKDKL